MFSSVRYHSKKNVSWMPKEPIALYYRIDNSFNDFREITRSEDRTPKVQRTIFARRFHLSVSHIGAYTLTTYVANVFRLFEGHLLETYKRKIMLVVVIHLEWDIAPGSRLDKAGGQYPFITASEMSSKYCWSVLRSVAVTSGNSASILSNETIIDSC